MVYRGRVQGGVVVLSGGASLPEGTEVEVMPQRETEATGAPTAIWGELSALGRSVEGRPCELPEDLARHHDHYLHGLPKRP